MAFLVNKMGKLADQLEERAYEWVLYEIQETYGVETEEDLSEDQLNEIEKYLDSQGDEVWIEGYCSMALRGIVDRNSEENNMF
ncbi:hypothetical protein N9D42_02620 [Candidatus Thioglobus sp.]|jgi:hypothetical protein|nr:hypothetical protein [Candidatus Thioglobus sp.]MDA9872318.1 hypothetical protein [Candidatus Thioglobus sp.]|tara:strand:+ start:1590 stop:1838 length:249 start_codon:yes stop_codon:yes gene_type:complete